MPDKILVGIVEDQALFREGMKAILAKWPEIDVAFEAAEGYTVIESLSGLPALPNVLLVDLSLPPKGEEEFSGIDLTRQLIAKFPEIKILILSVHNDENFIVQLIEQGAHGYLVKDSHPGEVHEAITRVHYQGSYINSSTLAALRNNMGKRNAAKKKISASVVLTRREEEILELICHQLTTDEIAEKLFISATTVNGHRNNLLQKTGSRNTAGLVVYALKNKIVHLL